MANAAAKKAAAGKFDEANPIPVVIPRFSAVQSIGLVAHIFSHLFSLLIIHGHINFDYF